MEIRQGGVVSHLLADVAIPRMFRAEQVFPREHIAPGEIPSVVERELFREPLPLQNPAWHDRGRHRRQPGHRQRGHHHPGRGGLRQGPGGGPLHRARHGQPRRRHGGGPAGGSGQLRHHPRHHGLRDPQQHGGGGAGCLQHRHAGVPGQERLRRPTALSCPAASSPTTPSGAPTRAAPAR